MSYAIVSDVDERYPDLLQENTHETDAFFCYCACQALGPDWYLLGKSGGEKGYTWPNGVRTSHDAICRVEGGRMVEQVDIIAGAGSGNPTGPSWGTIAPHLWRPSNQPVPLSDIEFDRVEPPVEPPPQPICPDPSRHQKPDCPDPSAHRAVPYPGDPTMDQVGKTLEADYAEAGQQLDAGAAIWIGRTIYDYYHGRLSLEASIAKHRGEWRRVLGI